MQRKRWVVPERATDYAKCGLQADCVDCRSGVDRQELPYVG
jgi:hypothetical protein